MGFCAGGWVRGDDGVLCWWVRGEVGGESLSGWMDEREGVC
jgi:hypothetical protein